MCMQRSLRQGSLQPRAYMVCNTFGIPAGTGIPSGAITAMLAALAANCAPIVARAPSKIASSGNAYSAVYSARSAASSSLAILASKLSWASCTAGSEIYITPADWFLSLWQITDVLMKTEILWPSRHPPTQQALGLYLTYYPWKRVFRNKKLQTLWLTSFS